MDVTTGQQTRLTDTPALPDGVAANLPAERLREVDARRLGGVVGRPAGIAAQAGDRRRVDDGATAGRLHPVDRFAAADHGRQNIETPEALPIRAFQVFDQAEHAVARDMHGYVETAGVVIALAEQPFEVVLAPPLPFGEPHHHLQLEAWIEGLFDCFTLAENEG